MTQVLAVLGDGATEAPVIDTAAALAEIAHARVRQDQPGRGPERRAGRGPGAGRTGQSRHSCWPCWPGMSGRGRSGGASRSGPPGRWSWCRLRRGAGGRRSAGCSCRWTGRRSRQRRWPVRWSSSPAPESISWCCTCSTLRPCQGSGIRLRTPGGPGQRSSWPVTARSRGVRLELRTGVAGERVLDVAEAEGADMIALGWSQQLDPGRARTVRRAVLDAVVPVMLVPMASG